MESDDKQEGVGYVSLVRNRQPEFQIFELLRMTLVNVDATGEAHLCQLLLREIVQFLLVQYKVLLPQLSKEHVKLASNEPLRHDLDEAGVYRNLHLEETQDVVEGVQTCDGLNTHKVGHMHERLGTEHAEVAVSGEKLAILEQVCR